MLERFREHLDDTGLIPPGSRVLVAYSGGADSTCLLQLLHLLQIDIVAAHLHHGQREEADKEQELCEAFCKELDIPFVPGKADVPKIAADLKMSIEEAGREARYQFFRQAAFQTGCVLIATAHTLSDKVETILLNLARGSGLTGLAGIPEKRENIVRPLMVLTREETRAYCDGLKFWYHDDPANQDITFSRARVRHRIVPEFRLINPSAEQAICRMGLLVAEEDRFLDSMAAAALEQCESPPNGDLSFLTKDVEVVLDRSILSTFPPVLFKRSIRLVVGVLGASLNADQTGALLLGIAEEEKGSITAEGGQVAIEWDEARVHARIVDPSVPFRSPVATGALSSDEFGWTLFADEKAYSGAKPKRASLETELDAASVKGPLHLRVAQAGDSMQPFGFAGTRKLSDLLSEAKLTKAARARLPVLCDMVGPVWVPGICLDNRVAPQAETERVWSLRFGPLQADAGA